MKLFRILDPFTLTLITVVLLASFFPARGGFNHRRHCAAVFYARGETLPRGHRRRRQPLAFTPVGDVQHVCGIPCFRRAVCLVGAD